MSKQTFEVMLYVGIRAGNSPVVDTSPIRISIPSDIDDSDYAQYEAARDRAREKVRLALQALMDLGGAEFLNEVGDSITKERFGLPNEDDGRAVQGSSEADGGDGGAL